MAGGFLSLLAGRYSMLGIWNLELGIFFGLSVVVIVVGLWLLGYWLLAGGWWNL
jgi:hypothetical protein